MANYTTDDLVTFLSAYDYDEPGSRAWHDRMEEGAKDFMEMYALHPRTNATRLVENYVKATQGDQE